MILGGLDSYLDVIYEVLILCVKCLIFSHLIVCSSLILEGINADSNLRLSSTILALLYLLASQKIGKIGKNYTDLASICVIFTLSLSLSLSLSLTLSLSRFYLCLCW